MKYVSLLVVFLSSLCFAQQGGYTFYTNAIFNSYGQSRDFNGLVVISEANDLYALPDYINIEQDILEKRLMFAGPNGGGGGPLLRWFSIERGQRAISEKELQQIVSEWHNHEDVTVILASINNNFSDDYDLNVGHKIDSFNDTSEMINHSFLNGAMVVGPNGGGGAYIMKK